MTLVRQFVCLVLVSVPCEVVQLAIDDTLTLRASNVENSSPGAAKETKDSRMNRLRPRSSTTIYEGANLFEPENTA
ncbi:MAG: hypothetical protein AMS22_14560 [Thiotrichales bacterium SG8_50]|nr:MAG: hypothetical protein AMS22_14560 [Thiotrichales bacterium SG8_50]